jgi:hypothetical protein
MIRGVIGKPGSGKSYWMTRRLVLDLLKEWRARKHQSRHVVTTLDIDRNRLAAYLDPLGCPLYTPTALTIIPKRDPRIRRFWRVRRHGEELNVTTELVDGAKVHKMKHSGRGTVYILDELQLHFRARDFAATSGEAQDYLSCHEHLGDTVIYATQDPDQLDVVFVRLTEEFVWLVNGRRIRFKFGFRGGRGFVAHHFYHPPKSGDHPTYSVPVRFDRELANIYRTSEAGDRDENELETGGLSWKWAAAGAAAIIVLVAVTPKVYASMKKVKRADPPPQVQAPPPPPPQQKPPKPPDSSTRIDSWMWSGDKVHVKLTNGEWVRLAGARASMDAVRAGTNVWYRGSTFP